MQVSSLPLLQQALERETALENTLQVNVFCLNKDSSRLLLQRLAELALKLNNYVSSSNSTTLYPWMTGGDGPVFGIHATEGIPHLRAVCRYGVSVADEWNLIALVQEFSAQNEEVAVECWDLDDGQVLLIQSALELPSWVDEIGPEHCRRRCWIRKGKLCLIQPKETRQLQTLSLQSALSLLASTSESSTEQVVIPSRVNQAIRTAIQHYCKKSASLHHTAAVAVPRAVAALIKSRPDLAAAACNAFCENSSVPLPSSSAINCEDWVWTTHKFGRTHYAALRTILSAQYKTSDFVPKQYMSVEVKRLQRQANATPHLRHGVQLGVRLMAGLDHLLAFKEPPIPSLEERIHYWMCIDQECGGSGEWVRQAFEAGPNHALHSLDTLLKCPVFVHAEHALTPLSHPETSVSRQIRTELGRKQFEGDFCIPAPNQVDTNEDWMGMPDEEEMRRLTQQQETEPNQQGTDPQQQTDVLDQMLQGVEAFMDGTSNVEGVATAERKEESSFEPINPSIFLKILHATLKAESAEELDFDKDPFFSEEDYDLGDDDDEAAPIDSEMVDLMASMDQQLRRDATNEDGQVTENVQILENLLKSMDMSAAFSGPVRNILHEMGIETPNLLPDEDGEEE